jgi:hypothetical protein
MFRLTRYTSFTCSYYLSVLFIALFEGAAISTFAAPQPEIKQVEIPTCAVVNRPITLNVVVTNLGDGGKAGGISISIPEEPQVSIGYVTTTSARIYPIGSKIWSRQAKKAISSKHLLFEAWQEPWQAGEEYRASIQITPKREGILRLFLRAAITSRGNKPQVTIDPESGQLDQQGFPAKVFTVKVMAGQESQKPRRESIADPTSIIAKKLAEEVKIYPQMKVEEIRLVRILHDFNNDEVDDVALVSSLSWGNAGVYWEIFLGGEDGGYIRLGSLFFHPLAISIQPVAEGISEIVTYSRLGAKAGDWETYRISREGIQRVVFQRSQYDEKQGQYLFGHLTKESLAQFCMLSVYLADPSCEWQLGYY